MTKLILDLCGGTGAWSLPYRDAGYDVEVITLPTYDVTKVEFGRHAMEFINQGGPCADTKTVLYDDVHGIMAAPPCTEFSRAKGSSPRDFSGGLETVRACLDIIWQCRIHKKLAFWALENPVGFLRQFLGRPHYTYEHWQYGDLQIKPTDIWGYFNEPAPSVKIKPQGVTKGYANESTRVKSWCNATCPDEYKGMGLDRAAIRAITPQGFARAFCRANK